MLAIGFTCPTKLRDIPFVSKSHTTHRPSRQPAANSVPLLLNLQLST
jgi:hypothetical protein